MLNKFTLLLVLTVGLCLAQFPARDKLTTAPPTVSYQWLPADCTGVEGAFNQISSGCAFPHLKVTARSYDPRISGFYILVTFYDHIEDYRTATTFTKNPDGSFSALFLIGTPETVVLRAVSALELTEGQTAVTH